MAKTIKVSTKKNKNITLTDAEYKAGGGEGEVYAKDGIAYKIYHDIHKMLPVAKIHELQVLKDIPEIIIPDEILFNQNSQEIGYSMKYVEDREYLCKLFTKGFRNKANVSNNDINELVKQMQRILGEIHKRKIIVGDYNEMNFVLDSSLKTVFHIDTDSWQTPSFKGTAIMPTVRDMTVPMGLFNEITDWYSWAIVTFQMYIGVHPYKGRHPKYTAQDFEKRVIDKISVFNSDVEIPLTAQDFSVIPKIQLDWYKEVFENGYRSVPPMIGAVAAFVSNVAKVMKSSDTFVIDDYYVANEKITRLFNFRENLYVLHKDGFYDFQTKTFYNVDGIVGLCEVINSDPVVVVKSGKTLEFRTIAGDSIGSTEYEKGFFYNGVCYTAHNGSLVENTFKEYRKVTHLTRICDNINKLSYDVYDGLVIQDIVGKYYFIIPHSIGYSASIRVVELDGHRIIDAKYMNKVSIVIAEKGGEYHRFIFNFNEAHDKYETMLDKNIDLHDVNFTVLPNGITMNIFGDERVELFQRISTQVKHVTNIPFDATNALYNHLGKVLYLDGNVIKRTTMKKP